MTSRHLRSGRLAQLLIASFLLCSCVTSPTPSNKMEEASIELDVVTTSLSKAKFPTLDQIRKILPASKNDAGAEHAYTTEGSIRQLEVITYRSVQTGEVERLNLIINTEQPCLTMKEAIDRWKLDAINIRPVLSESMGSVERTISSFSGTLNNALITAQSNGVNGSCVDKIIIDYSGRGPL